MAITASQVKELRDATGAGMMDAKRALQETEGNMEAAVDWLRTKGLAKAAKKAGRTAAEGLVGVAVAGGVGVAIELNSETDFVSRNAEFQQLVAAIGTVALGVRSLEELAASELDGKPVSERVTDAVARIGEHLSLRRFARVEGETVASYVHTAAAEGMGRIGVLVALKGADTGIGKQIAMHIAASSPAALDEAALDPAMVARERAIFAEQARESGKPEPVIEKMIEGRMRKFFAESTLLGQQFVIDPDLTVAQAAKDAGVEVLGYVRMAVGDGIEKEAEDYAAEVARLARG